MTACASFKPPPDPREFASSFPKQFDFRVAPDLIGLNEPDQAERKGPSDQGAPPETSLIWQALSVPAAAQLGRRPFIGKSNGYAGVEEKDW